MNQSHLFFFFFWISSFVFLPLLFLFIKKNVFYHFKQLETRRIFSLNKHNFSSILACFHFRFKRGGTNPSHVQLLANHRRFFSFFSFVLSPSIFSILTRIIVPSAFLLSPLDVRYKTKPAATINPPFSSWHSSLLLFTRSISVRFISRLLNPLWYWYGGTCYLCWLVKENWDISLRLSAFWWLFVVKAAVGSASEYRDCWSLAFYRFFLYIHFNNQPHHWYYFSIITVIMNLFFICANFGFDQYFLLYAGASCHLSITGNWSSWLPSTYFHSRHTSATVRFIFREPKICKKENWRNAHKCPKLHHLCWRSSRYSR